MDSLAEPASSIDWNLSALAADRRCDTIQPSAEHVTDDGIDAFESGIYSEVSASEQYICQTHGQKQHGEEANRTEQTY